MYYASLERLCTRCRLESDKKLMHNYDSSSKSLARLRSKCMIRIKKQGDRNTSPALQLPSGCYKTDPLFLNIWFALSIAGLDGGFEVVESTWHFVHFVLMSASSTAMRFAMYSYADLLFSISSLDIVLNLLVNWFNKSSTTCTRSEGCVSGAGYISRY